MINYIIYTEGGLELGLGNVYRSISLADAIKKRVKANITFITSSSHVVEKIITNSGYSIITCSKTNIPITVIRLKPTVLIIDFLGININFVKMISLKSKSKIVIIGNDTPANKYADIVVNAIVGTNFKNRKFHIQNTLYLQGPKYLVLRDEFLSNRCRYIHRGTLRKVTLLFGATDQSNYTCKVLLNLLEFDPEIEFSIIIGPGYGFPDELDSIINTHPVCNATVLRSINNVSKVMLESDFIVTSAGTALFEAMCLGVPVLALFQNDSQKKVFRDFFMTKNYEDIESLGMYINMVYNNISDFNKRVQEIKPGQGKDDFINEILKL